MENNVVNPAEVDETRQAPSTDASETEEVVESTETNEEESEDYSTLTPRQIVAKLMADENRDISTYSREIKVVNTIRKMNGDNGEYERVCLTLTKKIDGFVARENPDEGVVWEAGKTDMIFVLAGSILATIKNNEELAPYYNAIREDSSLLYTVLAGSKVKIVTENVPADTEYINPFGRNGAVREYDHDWCAVNIYEIISLGKAAREWLALQKLTKAGAFKDGALLKGILGI